MRYITIIGDSHAENLKVGVAEFARLNNIDVKINLITYHGKCIYNVDYADINTQDFSKDIILVHFGEVDIRRKLPKYNNAEETAKKYIEKTLDHFKNNRVIFVQPAPQALDELTYEFQSSEKEIYFLSERIKQQRIFNKTLENYKGIEIIKIIDAIGIEIATEDNVHDGCHLNRETVINLGGYIHNYIDKAVD